MALALKERVKRLPGVHAAARKLGLSSQGSWLFRRHVLEWTSDPAVVSQLPLPYRAFARYASSFFNRTRASRLWGGRAAFRLAALARRLSRTERATAPLHIDGMEVVVDLDDPRFLQVVNELTRSVDTAFLDDFVREGDTFIDVGANHGAFALVASRLVGPSGRVIAFEPQPQLADAVERSLAATAPCPFEVHAVALGDQTGTVDLLIPHSYSGTAGVFEAHSGTHPHRRVTVPLRKFDDAVDREQLPGCVFIKLDIEGSEYVFLRGAEETIRASRPVLLMELNRRSLMASATSERDMIASLEKLGYAEYADLEELPTRRPLPDLALPDSGSQNVLLFMEQDRSPS